MTSVPKGFTKELWNTFLREGIVTLPSRISADDCERYIAAIDRVWASNPGYSGGLHNLLDLDETFIELIDHPRHIGFAYDIFGEQTALHLMHAFVRPPGDDRRNPWHPDGPRVVPYSVFAREIPMVIKIGYWLTDLTITGCGNFVYLPGSHRDTMKPFYGTYESVDGEQMLKVPAGSITIMDPSIWHRVSENNSEIVRKNLFIGYCVSWINPSEKFELLDNADKLTRTQRILLRRYTDVYDRTRPPEEDYPLIAADHSPDPNAFVPIWKRKIDTRVEAQDFS